MDNGLSKTISYNDISYFKAILRDNLPTLDTGKAIKDIEIVVGLGGPSGLTTSQIITVDLNVTPKYNSKGQISAQIKFLREQLAKSGNLVRLLPLVLHNEYDDVIYTKEHIATGNVDAASCDDNVSKIIKKDETHSTFGTVLLRYDNNNNIENIILQYYTKNNAIQAFCVKSCSKVARYQTLYGALSALRENMLKQKGDIAKNIQDTSFFQLNLRQSKQTEQSWKPTPLTSYEVDLELRNTSPKDSMLFLPTTQ